MTEYKNYLWEPLDSIVPVLPESFNSKVGSYVIFNSYILVKVCQQDFQRKLLTYNFDKQVFVYKEV